MEPIAVAPPVDYPLDYPLDGLVAHNTDTSEYIDLDSITYALLLERFAVGQPITNEMIRAACYNMDAAQRLQFGAHLDDQASTIARILSVG